MDDTGSVHDLQPERRVPRGVRMRRSLWEFVDHLAGEMTDGNASRLIEKWVAEKREAVRKAA